MKTFYFLIGVAIGSFFFAAVALAAPVMRLERTLLPETNNLYDLGTSTQKWRTIYSTSASTTNLTISGIHGCSATQALVTNSSGIVSCGTVSGSSASTTLLGDTNTWSGSNTFNNTITGSISGNAGTVTNGVYITTFNTLFDNRLSASSSISGITTLPNLSLPYSQLTGVPAAAGFNFTPQSYGNSTSSIIAFTQGLIANASSTLNIFAINNLTSAGFVKTAAGTGALSVDTNTYLTGNQSITLSGAVTGTGATAITTAFGTLGQGVLGNPASSATIPTALATSSLYFGTPGQTLSYLNGVWIGAATTTFNSPLTYSNGSVSCASCNVSNATVSSVGTTWPLSGGTITTTGTLTWAGLATSSNISAASGFLYATGANTFASVSTSSALSMSITGNAGTVTTNANLSGVVTSVGNTTSFGSQTAGVLGSAITGNTSVLATSSLFGVASGGKVLGWDNNLGGIGWVATSSSGGSAFAWTPTTNYGATANATTSPIWLQGNVFASSSLYFGGGPGSAGFYTTIGTNGGYISNSSMQFPLSDFTLSGSDGLVKFSSGIASQYTGTSCTYSITSLSAFAAATCGGFAWPWTQQTQYGLNTSATTTLLQLTNGLTASSTTNAIRFGIQGLESLTIDTTGHFGIASSTPSPLWGLSIGTTTQFGGVQVAQYPATTTAAASYTVNWKTGNYQDFTLNQNANFIINATSSNPLDGGKYILRICEDGTGTYTATFVTPGQLRWTIGTTSISTTANTCSFIGMIYDAKKSFYQIIASSTNILAN